MNDKNDNSSFSSNKNLTKFDTFKGLLYMFFSCIFRSLFSIFSKYILNYNYDLTSYHLLMYKVYIMSFINILVIFYLYFFNYIQFQKINTISLKSLIFLIIRSILSIFGQTLTILSLKYMSISEVYSIYYLYPGFVILLTNLVLNEKVENFDYICFFFCFIGVLFVVRPNFDYLIQNNLILFLILGLLLSALFKSFEDIIIRYLRKDVYFLLFPIVYALIGLILYPIFLLNYLNEIKSDFLIEMSYYEWSIIFLIAVFSFSYQALMAASFKYENVGRADLINYFQVLFMFISDIYLFDKNAVFYDYLGIFFIFGFNLSNGIIKSYKRNKKIKINNNFLEENENLIQL
jgi:drug/metabolite transporter (DMT)-like permease